ncbi:MAG: hypothetical protein QXG10_04405 [Candidatus Hadarchaeales archaeon]
MNAKIGAIAMLVLVATAAVPAVGADTYEEARIRYLTERAELLQQISTWETARAGFLQAVSNWRGNRTESNLNQVMQAAKSSVAAMGDVMIQYMEMLKIRIEATRGLSDEEKTEFCDEIDGYVDALEGMKISVQNAGNAQEIRTTTRALWNHWLQIRVRLKYITGRVLIADAEAALWRVQAFAARIEAKIAELQENGVDTSALESWLAELNSRLETAEQRIENAKSKVEEITDNITFLQMFAAADAYIRDAIRYLREALRNLQEIIFEMISGGHTVTVSGSGTLVAWGNGSAHISVTGAVHVRARIEGTMIVSPDANVVTSGTGTRTELENGWVQYEGYGGAVVTGNEITVDISGTGIRLVVCGTGTATLTGTGGFRTYGVSRYEAENWNAEGYTVDLETGGYTST